MSQLKGHKLSNLRNIISKNTQNLWYSGFNVKYSDVPTKSCFNIKQYTARNKFSNIVFSKPDKPEIPNCKSLQIDMFPDHKQKNILHRWFGAYIEMYNTAIVFIKSKMSMHDIKLYKKYFFDKCAAEEKLNNFIASQSKLDKDRLALITKIENLEKKKRKTKIDKQKKIDFQDELTVINQNIKDGKLVKNDLETRFTRNNNKYKKQTDFVHTFSDYKKIRTYHLKDSRDNLIAKSFPLDKWKRIFTHIMDCAIQDACTSYKSCITNFIKGNIKKFRIKYWSHNKERKILKIEGGYIKHNQLCKSVLGDIKYIYNDKPYTLNPATVTVLYDSATNRYQLMYPEKIVSTQTNKTEFIGIDQGNRTFLNAITNNKAIKIGNNFQSIVKNYLKRIDKIKKNNNISDDDQARKSARYYRITFVESQAMGKRIMRNKVDELHWKSIKYLTYNYKTIIIGNLSFKGNNSNVSKIVKRVGYALRHSEFRTRLQYKCAVKGIDFKIVDEWGTSKTCSLCGHFKKDIGDKKMYSCPSCGKRLDRDLNSLAGCFADSQINIVLRNLISSSIFDRLVPGLKKLT